MRTKLTILQMLTYNLLRLLSVSIAKKRLAEFESLNTPLRSNSEIKPGPLIVVGLLSSSKGFGSSARRLIATFEATGIRVEAVDLTSSFGFPSVVRWQERPLSNRLGGTIVFCLNPHEILRAASVLPEKFLENRRLVGHFWWELETVPDVWLPIISQFDEVWCSSEFEYSIFARCSQVACIRYIPLIFTSSSIPPPDYSQPFTVLCASDLDSYYQRKNPDGAINAFVQAFGSASDVKLIVKITDRERFGKLFPELIKLIERSSNIELVSGNLEESAFANLIARSHVVLSLHRAEGLGLIPLEAMSMGRLAIATGWSGVLQYLNRSNSILVAYKMRTLGPREYWRAPRGSQWAEPDVRDAVYWLKFLKANPHLRESLSAAAKRTVDDQFGIESCRHIIERIAREINI